MHPLLKLLYGRASLITECEILKMGRNRNFRLLFYIFEIYQKVNENPVTLNELAVCGWSKWSSMVN